MRDFVSFAQERARLSADKYTLEDGRNAAMVRDNPVDVLEELADTYNLLILWVRHYLEVYKEDADPHTVMEILELTDKVVDLALEVEELSEKCTKMLQHVSSQQSNYIVARLVDWR